MIPLEETAPAPSKEELLKQLTPALKLVIDEDVNYDSDPEKLQQYWNARRNYLLWRGIQYFAPVLGMDGTVDLGPIGSSGQSNYGDGGSSTYDYVQNIFRGYGRKFIAVLGQRAPNVTAMPDDPDDENSVKATRSADTCNGILNSWWSVDEKNLEVAAKLWTTGPAFLYTPWNADGDRYGYRQEPHIEAQPSPMGEPTYHCQNCGFAGNPSPDGKCPQCGQPLGAESMQESDSVDVPSQTGIDSYANGRVECHVCDVFRVTTPFYTTDLHTCPWLRYEFEEHKGKLLKKWPELRGKNLDSEGSTTGTGQTGRLARDATMTPLGTSLRRANTRWNFARTWMQPWMYEFVKEDATRQILYDNFATGLRVDQVQGEIVNLEEEKLDELWAVIKPETSEIINGDPIGQDMVSAQMLVNDTLNIAAETIERGIPMTLADPRVFNFEQWNKRPASPCEIMPAMAAVGDTLGESFFPLPPAQFSNQMMPWIASVESGAQTSVGVQPEIFGGGDPAPTAREAEIRKNAALAQLGTTWTFIRRGWEKAKLNAVKQLAKYGPGIVREGQLMVEMADLLAGGWHFESDEAIPATWGQMRDLVMFMMEKPPQVLEAWGFNRPENIKRNKALLGMHGYYTPGEDDGDKVVDTIQQLLRGKPIQQPKPDGSTDIVPSIPADDFEDNHSLVVQLVQGWCQSQAGRTEKTQNPDGYSNVVAWGKAHAQLANPTPPPPPLPPPKMNIAVSSKDLPPQTLGDLFKDFKIPADIPAPPPGLAGAPLPPGAPPAPPPQAAPPPTVQ